MVIAVIYGLMNLQIHNQNPVKGAIISETKVKIDCKGFDFH